MVHHGGDEPILFESTPIGDFEPFFVGRIIDTLSGNRFVFAEGSETRDAHRAAQDDPSLSVETSKALARRFHRNDGRFQRGILIVTALRRKLAYKKDSLAYALHLWQRAGSSPGG